MPQNVPQRSPAAAARLSPPPFEKSGGPTDAGCRPDCPSRRRGRQASPRRDILPRREAGGRSRRAAAPPFPTLTVRARDRLRRQQEQRHEFDRRFSRPVCGGEAVVMFAACTALSRFPPILTSSRPKRSRPRRSHGRGPAAHRPRHGARRVDRRLRRADRDDDARRAGRLRGALDHPRSAARSSRSSRPSSAATRSPPAIPGSKGSTACPARAPASSWLVWAWASTVTLTLLQVGGMYGGVAQVLHLLVPAVPVNAWVGVCFASRWRCCSAAATSASSGFAIVKVGLFTLLTVCAAAVLLRRPGRGHASPISRRVSASSCRPPASRRRSPCSASPASARPSW